MYEIYGRNNCQWCDAAKALLERKGLKYTYHNIEENSKALSEFKFMFPNAKTVPQIVTGVYDQVTIIGGYKELEQWLNQSTQK